MTAAIAALLVAAGTPATDAYLDQTRTRWEQVSRQIWEFSEPALQEIVDEAEIDTVQEAVTEKRSVAALYALLLIFTLVLIDLHRLDHTLLAVSVLALGLPMLVALMGLFGDYARVGSATAWIYGVGMLVILFAPDTRDMQD